MNWRNYNGLRKGFEKGLTKVVKRALNKSVARVLAASKITVANLESFVDEKPIQELYLQIYKTVAYRFALEIFNELTGRAKKFADYRVKEIPGPDEFESFFQRYLQEYALAETALRITSITNTTREFVKKTVAEALAGGYSVEKTSQILRSQWQALTESRAVLIARTEIMTASNAGALVGAGATGLPLKKIWMATRDKRTREAHISAEGQKRDLDEPYNIAGQLLMHPGDSSLGADASNTIQCRCAQRFSIK
jgi:uncharacterized protein with gpF-like domain